MTQIILNPNLPEGRVITALAGKIPKSLSDAFLKEKIKIVELLENNDLQPSVASHADMLAHSLDSKRILLSKHDENVEIKLEKLGFEPIISSKPLSKDYPNDIALNSARIGKFLICNSKHTATQILDYCQLNNIEIINVAQGYAKCSTCIVNENAVITEDKTIKSECVKRGIDVLLINKGYVSLPGLNYGFIGGCSCLISKSELAFFGDIKKHPDYKNIRAFLNNYNIVPLSLTSDNLIDIGGLIPLQEEI